MLAALIPHDDELWFLKCKARTDRCRTGTEFDECCSSFQFVDKPDEPVAWTTQRWTVKPKTECVMPRSSSKTEDSPGDECYSVAGSQMIGVSPVVLNINRWRKQRPESITGLDLHKTSTESRQAGNCGRHRHCQRA